MNPAKLCPNVLKDDEYRDIELIRDSVTGYREALQEMAAESNDRADSESPDKNIRFKALTKVNELRLNGRDIANDCFHLSVYGQEKIARSVLNELGYK